MEASRIKTKIPRKLNEENAQYFFVLASFFEDDMTAQMDMKEIHQMLKYTMDSFVKFKGARMWRAFLRALNTSVSLKKSG